MPHKLRQVILTLFHFLLLTTPFIFTWVNHELFEFNKMLWVYGITTLITSLWLTRMVVDQRLHWVKTPFTLPITLFLISQLLSTLFSIHPNTSIFGYYTRFNGGLLSSVTYALLFFAFINNITKDQLKGLLTSLFIGALGISLYAIPEHFGSSPSCLLISGSFNVDCWIQDVQHRVFATFGQPNWLAAYVITLIPLGIHLSLGKKTTTRTKKSWFFFFTSILLFITLLFTGSRSGFIGLCIGLGLYVLKKPIRLLQAPLASLLIIFAVSALVFSTPFTPSLTDLWQNLKAQPTSNTLPEKQTAQPISYAGTESGDIRKIVWRGAWDVFKRYPVFGSGVETFAYSYYQDRPVEHNTVSEWDFLYNKAHNEFLNLLATTGLVGLSAYLFFLGSIFWIGAKHLLQKSTSNSCLVTPILSGLTALIISNFFGFSTVMANTLLFLYPAFLIVSTTKEITKQQDNKSVNLVKINSLVPVGIITLATLFILKSIITTWYADFLFASGKKWVDAQDYESGLELLESAAIIKPTQAIFRDELASTYSDLAALYGEQDDATSSAVAAQLAIESSDLALTLNPKHLNFYKTRSRMFISLAQLDETFLLDARDTLQQAIALAPTDPKLVYNLGLVEWGLGETNKAQQLLEHAVDIKPNYHDARTQLGQLYQDLGELKKAKEQYKYILEKIAPDDENAREQLKRLEAS